jgi:hypothetical protein
MATKKVTVPVSRRALLARLNRKLVPDLETVKRTRDNTRARQDLGEFYVVDEQINGIVEHDIDLEDFARKRGVLAKHEHLADG